MIIAEKWLAVWVLSVGSKKISNNQTTHIFTLFTRLRIVWLFFVIGFKFLSAESLRPVWFLRIVWFFWKSYFVSKWQYFSCENLLFMLKVLYYKYYILVFCEQFVTIGYFTIIILNLLKEVINMKEIVCLIEKIGGVLRGTR